jgi:hypothetical protein
VRILQVDGAPAGFDGAVKIDPLTAKASVVSGYTLVAPDVTTGTSTMHLELWDGAAYRPVDVPVGASLDTSATGTFPIVDRVVTFVSHVQAQRSTSSSAGSAPRSDAAAQHPSILVVTVDVKVTAGPDVVDAFTVVADYGRVTAHAGWLAGAA